jgi:signal transduction histidine kinase/ActR/RegA family two-component response regulator
MYTTARTAFRELVLGLGVFAVAGFAVAMMIWVNIDYMQAVDVADRGAREELSQVDAVIEAMLDQETGLRGYVVTSDATFLRPYELGRARFDVALRRLTADAARDPPAERNEIAGLAALAETWNTSVAAPQIAAVRAGRSARGYNLPGMAQMDTFRARIGRLRQAEDGLLEARRAAEASAFNSSRTVVLLGAALAFALIVLNGGRAIGRLNVRRKLAEHNALQLKDALEHAHAADRAKIRFLSNMSHEMRTPLNGVAGMAEALTLTALAPPQQQMVDEIRVSAAALDRLIGILLTLARDDGGPAPPLAATVFRLDAAVRTCAAIYVTEARAKGLNFDIEVASEAEGEVKGDAERLGQLLGCLLSNAVKFTDAGAVRLSVGVAGPDRFAFEVADTGIGFDEATKARLFETFGQFDDSETRRYGGAGVGLALARRLAAELGGVLDAHSVPGDGSRFSFNIELSRVDGALAAANEVVAPASETALRVLIVDDHPTNRRVLELILEALGVEFVSAENGEQAIAAAGAEAFAAILMDIQMPVMDGLTATREIRRLEREGGKAATPIVIVSASCQPEHVQAGQIAGAQAHLGKPVSARALVEALNGVLAQAPKAA